MSRKETLSNLSLMKGLLDVVCVCAGTWGNGTTPEARTLVWRVLSQEGFQPG